MGWRYRTGFIHDQTAAMRWGLISMLFESSKQAKTLAKIKEDTGCGRINTMYGSATHFA